MGSLKNDRTRRFFQYHVSHQHHSCRIANVENAETILRPARIDVRMALSEIGHEGIGIVDGDINQFAVLDIGRAIQIGDSVADRALPHH